jgi:hypothetical protein
MDSAIQGSLGSALQIRASMLQIPFELRLKKISEGISIYITGFSPKGENGFTLTLLNGAVYFPPL